MGKSAGFMELIIDAASRMNGAIVQLESIMTSIDRPADSELSDSGKVIEYLQSGKLSSYIHFCAERICELTKMDKKEQAND